MMSDKPPLLATDAGFAEAVRNTIANRIGVLSSDDGSGMYAELEAFVNRTDRIVRDYNGRQVFEMLQNMDDQMRGDVADNARCSEVLLDKRSGTLSFRNNGRPFSFGGIVSILRPDISPKEKQPTIGNKGLGFRSLLNWKPRELVIRAGDIELVFSADAADRVLADNANLRCAVEVLRSKGKELPILSFPDIGTREGVHEWTTEIALRGLSENAIESIEKELRGFHSETLLFLPNLRKIEIRIEDGDTYPTVYSDTSWEPIDERNHIFKRTICTEAGDKPKASTDWLAFRKDGRLNVGQGAEDSISNYNVAIAVPLGGTGWTDSRNLRNYLPVRDVVIELPCLVHATVALNDTRDGLPPDNPADTKIFEDILPSAIKTFAEFLRDNAKEEYVKDLWFPWRLLSPPEKSPNPYVGLLYEKLHSLCASGAFVPCVDDNPRTPNDSRYFAKAEDPDGIVAFFNKHKNLLPNHVLSTEQSPVPESFGDHPCNSGELKTAINNAVASANLSDEELAELIHVLWRIRKTDGGTETFNVLRSEDNRFQETGESIYTPREGFIFKPSFMPLESMSQSLWAAIRSRFSVEEKNWPTSNPKTRVRSFYRKGLSKIVNVVWYDKTAVSRQMVLACREQLRHATNQLVKRTLVSQLLVALYQNFDTCDVRSPEEEQESDEVSDSGEPASRRLEYPIDVGANGEVRNAGEFLFESAKVFYDGALPEDIFLSDEKARNLLRVSDGDDAKIKAFFRSLGVRDDVRVKFADLSWGTDFGYFEFLEKLCREPGPEGRGLPKHRNTVSNPVKSDQTVCRFRDAETLRSLSTDNLLKMFCGVSGKGLIELLTEKPKIWWWESGQQDYKLYDVDWSFCAFQLKDSRKNDLMESLKAETYVAADSPTERVRFESALVALERMGARQKLEDLEPEELYSKMGGMGAVGVQSFYRRVLTALNAKIDQAPADQRDRVEREFSELAKRHISKLWARKRNGPVELKNLAEIRYWDNTTLSRKILDNCWKLEIGNRAGAPSVNRRFGVTILDGSSAALIPEELETSEELTRELSDRLVARAVCLLAIRCRDVSNQKEVDSIASLLRGLPAKVLIVRRGVYLFEGRQYELDEGDLIQAGDTFVIRSGAPTLEFAFKNPIFCQAVGEMLGIKLNLSDSRAVAEIRNAAKSTDDEMNAIRRSDLSEADWTRAEEALGLGEEEQTLWCAGLNRSLGEEDKRQLSDPRSRISKMEELVGKSLPEILREAPVLRDMTARQTAEFVRWLGVAADARGDYVKRRLNAYFNEQLEECQRLAFGSFASSLHENLENNAERQPDYCLDLERFYQRCPDWLEETMTNLAIENPVPAGQEIWAKFKTAVITTFSITLSEQRPQRVVVSPPKPRDDCLELLRRLGLVLENLDAASRSLAFFSNPDRFIAFKAAADRLHSEIHNPEPTDSMITDDALTTGDASTTGVTMEIVHDPSCLTTFVSRRNGQNKGHGRHASGRGVSYDVINAQKQAKGKEAQRIAWRAMLDRPTEFIDPEDHSSESANGTSDDSRGYDFSYTDHKGERRFVDVKAFDNGSFIMPENEHKVAYANKERYDLFLVDVKKRIVHFVKAPFSDTSQFMNRLILQPDTWKGMIV